MVMMHPLPSIEERINSNFKEAEDNIKTKQFMLTVCTITVFGMVKIK